MKQLISVATVVVMTVTSALLAQEKSVNPGINESFEDPDVQEFIEKFEGEDREVYDRRKAIVEACELKPGMVVADIGAGTGFFTRMFAKSAGPKGRVYAVDISEKFVEHIEQSAQKEGLKNVVGVVANQKSVNLPPNSVDLAFICATYHHFEFPHKTMRSIHRALKPDGQVILIEFHRIEGKSSEWVMEHVRAGQDVFTREVTEAGFQQVEEKKDLLDESYFVRFEKVKGHSKENDRSRSGCSASVSDGESAILISSAATDSHGILVHTVKSPYQSGETEIRALLPDHLEAGKRYPVVYVLPVEAGRGTRFGDGLLEVQQHDLHNKHDAIFVAPTFSALPWYAEHPTKPEIRQASHFVEVVLPFVEKAYPASEKPEDRLLLGFSKSGWGAWSLLLRHPETFGRAAAWDAPLMMENIGKYGTGDIFGTQESFAQYRPPLLLRAKAETLRDRKRLILTGYGNFREHHRQVHALLDDLEIPHEYRDGPQRKHDWHSGWLPEAVGLLTGTRRAE